MSEETFLDHAFGLGNRFTRLRTEVGCSWDVRDTSFCAVQSPDMPNPDMLHKFLIVIPMQGITGFAADSICQGLEIYGNRKKIKMAKDKGEPQPERKEYDLRRSTIFACVGAFIIGPMGITRYTLYDWWFPGAISSHCMSQAVPKHIRMSLILTCSGLAVYSNFNSHLFLCCCGLIVGKVSFAIVESHKACGSERYGLRFRQGPSTLGVSGHADGLGKPPGFFHVPKTIEK